MGGRFLAFERSGPIPAPPHGLTWDLLMQIALAEADKAFQENEIPVGALIVDPYGTILQKAHNGTERLNDPTAHAEIMAIRGACQKINNIWLPDCILISTLEPCLMCSAALVQARISGLVFGAYDSQAGCISSFAELLTAIPGAGKIWHMGGVLSEECAAILNRFFAKRR